MMPFDWDENQQPLKATFGQKVQAFCIACGFAVACFIFGYAIGK